MGEYLGCNPDKELSYVSHSSYPEEFHRSRVLAVGRVMSEHADLLVGLDCRAI
ncbi:MAG TPA: hypothetical protein VJ836_06805 [Candidatus Saccharimonadales bacterium]|nr:hypothetical protein [Candidatus Saccharimonadales bacterium]